MSSLTMSHSPSTTTTTCNLIGLERSADTSSKDDDEQSKKREVYRFKTDWLVSSVAWSNEANDSFQLALCSIIEDYNNRVQLVRLTRDSCDQELESTATFDHPYPASKVLWIPRQLESKARLPQLLATSADYLRLWRLENGNESGNNIGDTAATECDSTRPEVKLESLLNPNQGMKHCAPLTSFDWNEIDPSLIVTASVDTTCAIWDIETAKLVDTTTTPDEFSINNNISIKPDKPTLRTQLVAHNHEVYDVSFSRSGTGRDVFVSCGGDGAVRLFDLRRLSTSTLLYEASHMMPSDSKALVRVACNKQDANYVATFATNSKDILVLDLRQPGKTIAVLGSHTADLNSISWAPHSAHHICSASDDRQALIWELSKLPNPIDEPLLAYRANGKINMIDWSVSHSDWIAICFENYLELLRV